MNRVRKTLCASILALFLVPIAAMPQEETESSVEAPAAATPEMTQEERRAAYEAMSDDEKAAVRDRAREARQKRRAENESPFFTFQHE